MKELLLVGAVILVIAGIVVAFGWMDYGRKPK